MKAYCQYLKNESRVSLNALLAKEGFRQMGFEIIDFETIEEINSQPEDIIVGGIQEVQAILSRFEIFPEEINYPKELESYLGRKISISSVNTIASNPDLWNVFIKPSKISKKFTGVYVKSAKDLIACGDQFEDTEVFVSEPVTFLNEWRCFVRYGKILDVRPYRGNWRYLYNPDVIEKAVQDYTTAPAGYGIDFGVTNDGRTLLVEVNDGYSLGAYGLSLFDYAKLLSARWAQLTNTEDFCNF